MAREYNLLTSWHLDAPVDAVWMALHDAARYPDWWPGVRGVEQLEQGTSSGAGSLVRFKWASGLLYTLTFDVRITEVARPHLLAGTACGELEGTGTWRLRPHQGDTTAATYHWRVHATKRWMRLLDPLLRPIFVCSHDRLMRRGAEGLAGLLAGLPPG